ncbi:YqzG/YhdC family protein [Bacillus sp. V3B]|uniref:DUF3889 domain-containing protein n=1 Tax=Bacillus sp. V3B TaxID=2804915 RepID=UPI00210B7C07|nr:DUF3889 domain-containing protein [Bacillus sp. V3B]MCQ6276807.1 YqzG/YhdC family protein [Bacillus sp. V3B]
MKRIIFALLFCAVSSLGISATTPFNTNYMVHAEKETPPYAKWGNLAVQKTTEKYPNTKVVDYLHVGKENKDKTAIEKFKLWLKSENKEFGVFVNIEFDKSTEQIVNITFKEVSQ